MDPKDKFTATVSMWDLFDALAADEYTGDSCKSLVQEILAKCVKENGVNPSKKYIKDCAKADLTVEKGYCKEDRDNINNSFKEFCDSIK